jgi:hypothetical protein
MRYVYFLMALTLIGCGKPEAVSSAVAPELAPLVSKFAQDVGVEADGVEVAFADLKIPTVGLCLAFSNGRKTIQIDNAYWAKASDDEKEQTVYHELGHCILGLDHNAALNSYGCPISIMYPYTFGNSNCYYYNKAYYYQELMPHK